MFRVWLWIIRSGKYNDKRYWYEWQRWIQQNTQREKKQNEKKKRKSQYKHSKQNKTYHVQWVYQNTQSSFISTGASLSPTGRKRVSAGLTWLTTTPSLSLPDQIRSPRHSHWWLMTRRGRCNYRWGLLEVDPRCGCGLDERVVLAFARWGDGWGEWVVPSRDEVMIESSWKPSQQIGSSPTILDCWYG